MSTASYLEFIPCCETSIVLNFKVPFGFDVLSSVYQYTGTSENGLIKNSCYTVAETLGTIPFVSGLPAINAIDLTSKTGCDVPECECDSLVGFEILACCDTAIVTTININFSSCGEFDNSKYVINYTGPGFTTSTGFVFQPGECYNISRLDEPGIYPAGPPCEDFTVGVEYRLCDDAINDDFCPACELGLQYLIFTDCCTENIILFKGTNASSYYGVQEYLGPLVNGLTNVCYSIDIGTVGDGVVDVTAWNNLPEPPLYNVSTFNAISEYDTDCTEYPKECPKCEIPCYTLIDCDGNFFNTTSDLLAYVGTFVKVNNGVVSLINTYLVLENLSGCKNAVNTISVSLDDPEPCPLICYQVTGNPTTVTYVNSDRELVVTSGNVKICSYATPLVTGPTIGYVIALGLCIDEECPDICFEFTNCETGEVLVVSNSPSIIEYYAQEQIVTINGFDGCWSIEITEECECPISVTVLTAYASCSACLPIVNYKFTNCNNQAIIIYSTEDYSEYVGQTVELECGECWFVSEIDFIPPSTQPVIINFTFPNCNACNKTYYKLINCLDENDIIYTSSVITGLEEELRPLKSSKVDNFESTEPVEPGGGGSLPIGIVITLKECEGCWIVEETREPINPTTVTQLETYVDCEDCAIIPPIPEPIVLPKRKVKPGYSTPTCDIDKYEKITCRASEIFYKEVMRLRYGLTNCCPDDDEKWLIKKELIDLDALRDLDYICKPTTSCCNQPITSCGCGCNSTLKTCNS